MFPKAAMLGILRGGHCSPGTHSPKFLCPPDLHWQHLGVGEPIPAPQHLRDRAGAAVRGQSTGREPPVSTRVSPNTLWGQGHPHMLSPTLGSYSSPCTGWSWVYQYPWSQGAGPLCLCMGTLRVQRGVPMLGGHGTAHPHFCFQLPQAPLCHRERRLLQSDGCQTQPVYRHQVGHGCPPPSTCPGMVAN